MLLEQIREESIDGATLSKLFWGETFICDILEDVVREVDGQSVASWKIKGVTAIPRGTYRLTFEDSPRFGPNTITVNAVPGYTGVRVHGGNRSTDTEGCLLPGLRNGVNTVRDSQICLTRWKLFMTDAMRRGEDVFLRIT